MENHIGYFRVADFIQQLYDAILEWWICLGTTVSDTGDSFFDYPHGVSL
jgi:hypothetical protein